MTARAASRASSRSIAEPAACQRVFAEGQRTCGSGRRSGPTSTLAARTPRPRRRRHARCFRWTWPSSGRPSGGGRSAASSWTKGLAGGRLALGDLVLVMREDQVDAAGVDVERRPEVGHAHRRAFDVPARPARSDRRCPSSARRAWALPEGEVADVVLAVLVGLDPLADPHPWSGSSRARRPYAGQEAIRKKIEPSSVR
jgi:hypothetical protein